MLLDSQPTYDELVTLGLRASGEIRWFIGDLACLVETHYGDHSLESFADDIGVEYGTLRTYKSVARAFPAQNVARATNCWTVYRVLLGHTNRQVVAQTPMTAEQARELVAADRAENPVPPHDPDEPPAERKPRVTLRARLDAATGQIEALQHEVAQERATSQALGNQLNQLLPPPEVQEESPHILIKRLQARVAELEAENEQTASPGRRPPGTGPARTARDSGRPGSPARHHGSAVAVLESDGGGRPPDRSAPGRWPLHRGLCREADQEPPRHEQRVHGGSARPVRPRSR